MTARLCTTVIPTVLLLALMAGEIQPVLKTLALHRTTAWHPLPAVRSQHHRSRDHRNEDNKYVLKTIFCRPARKSNAVRINRWASTNRQSRCTPFVAGLIESS